MPCSSIPEESLLPEIDRFVRENERAIVRDIARLVRIPSVEGPSCPGAPFGAEPKRALDCVLEIARELGLHSVNCGDRIGYSVVGEDRGRGHLATITHVDVVPAGDGWPADPFVLREEEGYLLGRGVLDDKGPSVLCLYALKYLQESGRTLPYPVRAIFGSNEETGMGDLDYYLAREPEPLFCFSPDAEFPLINGEKGIYHALLASCCRPENVLEIRGGVAANAVPAAAFARVRASGLKSSAAVTVTEEADGTCSLSSAGISGHASVPEGTVNAIGLLIDYLLENGIPSPAELPYFRFLARLHASSDGSGLGLQSSDAYFSPLTAVGGKISVEDGRFVQTIDCRYGVTMSCERITALLQEAGGDAADVLSVEDQPPFYVGADNPAVRICMDSYNRITGEEAKPVTIGGGTYARHFHNAVAFGPEHPERPSPAFCGPIHGINEGAPLADFLEALKIYIFSLVRLEELDF